SPTPSPLQARDLKLPCHGDLSEPPLAAVDLSSFSKPRVGVPSSRLQPGVLYGFESSPFFSFRPIFSLASCEAHHSAASGLRFHHFRGKVCRRYRGSLG